MGATQRSCVCHGDHSACQFGFLFDRGVWWTAADDGMLDDGSTSGLSYSSSSELRSPKLQALFDQVGMLKSDGDTSTLSPARETRKAANGRLRRGSNKQKRLAKAQPPGSTVTPPPCPQTGASTTEMVSPSVEAPEIQAPPTAPPADDTMSAPAETLTLGKQSHDDNAASAPPSPEFMPARFVKTPKERAKKTTFVSLTRNRRKHGPTSKNRAPRTRATCRNNSHIAAHKLTKAANKPAAWPGKKKKNVKREVALKFARFRYWVSDKLKRS